MLRLKKWEWVVASIGAVILLLVGAASITPSMIHPPYEPEPSTTPSVVQTAKPKSKPQPSKASPSPNPERPASPAVRPSPGTKDVGAVVAGGTAPQARTEPPAPLKAAPQPLPQRPPIVTKPILPVPDVTTPRPIVTLPAPIVTVPEIPLPVPSPKPRPLPLPTVKLPQLDVKIDPDISLNLR